MDDDEDTQATPTPSGSASEGATTTASDHLSFPSASTSVAPPAPLQTAPRPKQLLKDRLYVGNLHPVVDEYTMLTVFQKYGKIAKLDFMFHKAGPMKGKPRGYAFVEYSDPNDASRALGSANDKLLRGRKLVVTYAHQAPMEDAAGGRVRKTYTDPSKPTTLSLLKSSASGRSNVTEDKIAKMEAKLRQMEQSDVLAALHPSLPSRPAHNHNNHDRNHNHNQHHNGSGPSSTSTPMSSGSGSGSGSGYVNKGKSRAGPPLPSLPMQPPAPVVREGTPGSGSMPMPAASAEMKRSATAARRGGGLQGVKLVKHREK